MQFFASKLNSAAWQAGFTLLDRFASRRATKALPRHLLLGQRGEEAALFHLRKQGFLVVAHGWRSGRVAGDLDIVAWEGETLCFVEVKTRSNRSFAAAEAAVDWSKRRQLRRLARHYLRQLPEQTPARFDILSVYFGLNNSPAKGEYELFRNAFDWVERESR